MTFKIIIAGSRSFNDYNFLREKCDYLLSNKNESEIEIVSGGARGADKLGEKYAKEKGYGLKVFPADWSLGKKAGYIRNKQMSEYGDALIAFMEENGTKGTQMMINLAKERNLPTKIIKF